MSGSTKDTTKNKEESEPVYLQPKDITKLANILLEDMFLLQNWETLCGPLEITTHSQLLWRRKITVGVFTFHDLINEILTEWVAKGTRTVPELVEILADCEFKMTSGMEISYFNLLKTYKYLVYLYL